MEDCLRKYMGNISGCSVAVITSPCHGEDRGFDSLRSRQRKEEK